MKLFYWTQSFLTTQTHASILLYNRKPSHTNHYVGSIPSSNFYIRRTHARRHFGRAPTASCIHRHTCAYRLIIVLLWHPSVPMNWCWNKCVYMPPVLSVSSLSSRALLSNWIGKHRNSSTTRPIYYRRCAFFTPPRNWDARKRGANRRRIMAVLSSFAVN